MNIPRSKALSRDITSHVCTGFILDAFHYARLTGQRSVELTKGKWNDIIRKKQNFQPDRSGPFTFPPKFLLLLCEVGLETRIFLKVSDGPDRPVKEDHLWRWTTFSGKFPPGPKRPIYVSTKTSGNFGIFAFGNTLCFLSVLLFAPLTSCIYKEKTSEYLSISRQL